MHKRSIFTVLTAMLLAATAGAIEIKLPFDAESLAAQASRKCPESVKVSGDKDVLTVSISDESKGAYDGQYTINAKKGAGRSVDFAVDIKTENVSSKDRDTPKSIGKISIGNASRHISGVNSDWQSYVFKNVKIPANGLVKIRLSLRNVYGDISIRNPRVNVDLPQRMINNRKKKNKKSKN